MTGRCRCSRQPDSHGCDRPATAEDLLCNCCRAGCATWAYLGPQDTALHLAADAADVVAALDEVDA